MIALFVVSLFGAFLCLVLASQLPDPAWRVALTGLAVSAAAAVMSGVAALLSRALRSSATATLVVTLIAAMTTVATRPWLLAWLEPPEAVPQIDYLRIQLAALSVVSSIFALLGGAAALPRASLWYHWAAVGAIITAGLFGLGPLLVSVGVPVDHRAFLSLLGLGVVAWALVEAARRLGTR